MGLLNLYIFRITKRQRWQREDETQRDLCRVVISHAAPFRTDWPLCSRGERPVSIYIHHKVYISNFISSCDIFDKHVINVGCTLELALHQRTFPRSCVTYQSSFAQIHVTIKELRYLIWHLIWHKYKFVI